MNVVVAGGGTGGHVFPALATATALREAHGATIIFIGARDGQEATLVPAAGFRFVGLDVAAAQSRFSLATVRAVRLAFRGARACRRIVASADVVVSIGGFASAPAALAARRTRTPLVLIEPNSIPGVVNRIAVRWATAVATTFEHTTERLPPGVRIERTGNPIRREIAGVAEHRDRLRADALGVFDLEPNRTTVLVTGGSQGARHLDEVVAAALPELASRGDLQLLVATGPAHFATVRDAIDPDADLRVRAVGFIERMELALAVADLAVSRSGGGVAELTAAGLPSILVPYPFATEHHQEANARELVAAGAARLLPDEALSSSTLTRAILELVDDADARRAMGAAARRWARPDAAERIARLAIDVAGQR
jgi:UDP-N-acetylglucosamine--N-acetylmuramyl-(pentapeptide) pyrophosphoryl-undecaprenol N-acetylglucosamine transferase